MVFEGLQKAMNIVHVDGRWADVKIDGHARLGGFKPMLYSVVEHQNIALLKGNWGAFVEKRTRAMQHPENGESVAIDVVIHVVEYQ